MKGKNNDFSIYFYHQGALRLFLKYVHNTDNSIRWVNSKGIIWDTAVIYHRRTRTKLQTLKNLDVVSPYSCTFVNAEIRQKVLHLPDVPNVSSAIDWALKRGFVFHYVNVYNNYNRLFIERVYL